MPKKLLKKYMPDHDTIRHHKTLNKIFGTLLHDPNLLHLNRRSVSSAFFIGLFNAFVPVPFQMALSAAAAIIFRTNLPIAVGLVWITNPLTIPPIFYFSYKVGTWLLGTPIQEVAFELSWEWLSTELLLIWQPFLLGCFICGLVSGTLGYVTIRLLWRLHLIRHIKERKQKWAEYHARKHKKPH